MLFSLGKTRVKPGTVLIEACYPGITCIEQHLPGPPRLSRTPKAKISEKLADDLQVQK